MEMPDKYVDKFNEWKKHMLKSISVFAELNNRKMPFQELADFFVANLEASFRGGYMAGLLSSREMISKDLDTLNDIALEELRKAANYKYFDTNAFFDAKDLYSKKGDQDRT